MLAGVFAAVTLIAAAGAMPGQESPQPNPAEKRVCRSAMPTGSVVPKRVCRTKAEWARIDAGNAKNVDQFRETRGSGTAVPLSRQ